MRFDPTLSDDFVDVRALVALWKAVVDERDRRERMVLVGAGQVARHAGDEGRVQPAAQLATDRERATQTASNGLLKQFEEALGIARIRGREGIGRGHGLPV